MSGRYGYPGRPDGCLAACIATALQCPDLVYSLPIAEGPGWFERINEQLAHTAERMLLELPADELPWRYEEDLFGELDIWIAAVDGGPLGDPDSMHAVLALDRYVTWDPQVAMGRRVARDE